MLNSLFNTLAYQPHGSEQGYLFWGSWLSHIAQSLTNLQDAQGSMVRGLFMGTCSELQLFEVGLADSNPALKPLLALLNAPDWSKIGGTFCPTTVIAVNKQAPSPSRILTMVAFAGSCVGLLLFLWISFGGSIPLAAQGYRLKAEFGERRAAGPAVRRPDLRRERRQGRLGLARPPHGPDQGGHAARQPVRAAARRHARDPAPEVAAGRDLHRAHARDRRTARSSPTAGRSRAAQIAPTVQLDQILSTFDPATRRAFSIWLQQGGQALTDRGQQFNAAIGQLYPFATNVEAVLNVLNRDDAATSALLRDGGKVFGALAQSPSQLQGLIRNSNAVFASTAARNQELAAAIKAFPAFTVATRQTVDRVHEFAASGQRR